MPPLLRSGAVILWAVATATLLTMSSSASLPAQAIDVHPPACDTVTTRTTYSRGEGEVIRSVRVRTDAPVALPIAGTRLASLRRTTESRIVSRQVIFSAGHTIDTLQIAETLRRLRDQGLYADVLLEVARCAGSDSVDLTVATRDAWTLRPIARLVPPATVSLGVEDRNLLGTAQSITASNDQTQQGHGGTFSFTDPWLLGTHTTAGIRFSDVAGNHLLRAVLRHHEITSFDPWRADVSLTRQTFSDMRALEHPLGTLFTGAQVGRVVGTSRIAVTVFYGGVELDSARVVTIAHGDTGVPTTHGRKFLGVDMGLSHTAAQFDTASWFAHRGFLDIPRGFEGDVLIAPGSDRVQHATAARFDAWAGRMWMPGPGHLVTTDAWTSGFVGNVRANQIDRLAVTAYEATGDGYAGGRLMFEQLLALDPDERILSLATVANDPSFAAVPESFRLANRAVVASVERSLHIRPLGRASTLDGALFSAASVRWDAPAMGQERFSVAVVGARLRVLSANGTISSTRIDVSFPVVASGSSVVRRPLLSVSLAPLFDASRQRDGRRRQQ